MIKVENVSKTYKLDDGNSVVGLKNVSFEVKEGEILGIMGKSGSGKTTLLRALRGVEQIDEGSITIGDVSIDSDSSQYYYNKLKKVTAIHLQRSFGLWPDTVRENVLRKLYSREYYDEGGTDFEVAESEFGEEADRILELVSLTHKKDHYASVLSGGEKQKIDIIIQFAIRDMLCKFSNFSSNIIVLDEIFDNLDNIGCDKVLNLITTKLTDIESIYIITHHTDIEIPFDNILTIVKENNGISRLK